jgi:hypothetical protein
VERLDDKKATAFTREFQDLWVAGMAGTFFFFTWRSLAQDIIGATPQFAADSIVDRGLRYSFLLWLFAYFFVAGIENKQPATKPTWRDIVFDVTQSTFSVIAALYLGFVLQLPRNDWAAHFAASLAVAITGGLSFLLFARKSKRPTNVLRLIALVVGLVFLGVLLGQSVFAPGPPSSATLKIVGVGQVVLWLVLLDYLWLHLKPDA